MDANGIYSYNSATNETAALYHAKLYRPNGLKRIPGTSQLIVSDSGNRNWHIVDVATSGHLSYRGVFANAEEGPYATLPGNPDGLEVRTSALALSPPTPVDRRSLMGHASLQCAMGARLRHQGSFSRRGREGCTSTVRRRLYWASFGLIASRQTVRLAMTATST